MILALIGNVIETKLMGWQGTAVSCVHLSHLALASQCEVGGFLEPLYCFCTNASGFIGEGG